MSQPDSCPGCGSSLADREGYRARNHDDTIPTDLKDCPHCGAKKCCMCDGGDDVGCLSCDGDNDNSGDEEES